MLTKKDKSELVEELSKVFVTKKEFKHDLIQFKDDILFEIKAMREELSVDIGYRQMIENHEERLEVLEQSNKKKPSVH
jgi:hypothetical protein